MATRVVSDADLDAARLEGDPEADAVVDALADRAWAINALLARVGDDGEPIPSAVPEAVRALVVPDLPPWADLHRIRAAQAFADRHLASITVALFCAALPASYAAARGARVLSSTGRLQGDLDRRVNETARFVLAVLRPNGFDAGGRARIAVGKVRLIHAAVRRSLRARTSGPEIAISQEDMLGTVGLFSVTVLDALARLGVASTKRERDDFVHLWRVTGALLGVRSDLLADDYAGAKHLLERVRVRNAAPSPEGRALMRDLLAGMERHACLPGLRDLPRELVRFLVGDDLANILGVPPTPAIARSAIHRIGWKKAHHVLGRRTLEAMTFVKLGGAPTTFAMPTGR